MGGGRTETGRAGVFEAFGALASAPGFAAGLITTASTGLGAGVVVFLAGAALAAGAFFAGVGVGAAFFATAFTAGLAGALTATFAAGLATGFTAFAGTDFLAGLGAGFFTLGEAFGMALTLLGAGTGFFGCFAAGFALLVTFFAMMTVFLTGLVALVGFTGFLANVGLDGLPLLGAFTLLLAFVGAVLADFLAPTFTAGFTDFLLFLAITVVGKGCKPKPFSGASLA